MNYTALAAFAKYSFDEVLTKPTRRGGVIYKSGDTLSFKISLKHKSSDRLESTAYGVYLTAREKLENEGFEAFQFYLNSIVPDERKKGIVEKIFELASKSITEHFCQKFSFEEPSQAKEFLSKNPGARMDGFFDVIVPKEIPEEFKELAK